MKYLYFGNLYITFVLSKQTKGLANEKIQGF
jgi:hypothetical protein